MGDPGSAAPRSSPVFLTSVGRLFGFAVHPVVANYDDVERERFNCLHEKLNPNPTPSNNLIKFVQQLVGLRPKVIQPEKDVSPLWLERQGQGQPNSNQWLEMKELGWWRSATASHGQCRGHPLVGWPWPSNQIRASLPWQPNRGAPPSADCEEKKIKGQGIF